MTSAFFSGNAILIPTRPFLHTMSVTQKRKIAFLTPGNQSEEKTGTKGRKWSNDDFDFVRSKSKTKLQKKKVQLRRAARWIRVCETHCATGVA
jgi:hypothetical protein